MQTFICEICQKRFPMDFLHEHHKIPKALGGSDDRSNLATLCHSDHNNLHTIAYAMINPKRKHTVDALINSIFPTDPQARKRLIDFSALVAREMSLKKEIKKEEDAVVRVVIEIPARYMELLRMLGYDNPHKNGKPKGVSRIVREILAEHLIRKFPQHRQVIINLFEKT